MNDLLPDIFTILPTLLGGLKISLLLTFFSLLIGLPIGLVFSFGIVAPNKTFRYVSVLLVEVGRGAPALVLLQLMYYGLPECKHHPHFAGLGLPGTYLDHFCIHGRTLARRYPSGSGWRT